MLRKLLPLLLALLGLGGGVGAGFALKPPPEAEHAGDLAHCPAPAEPVEAEAPGKEGEAPPANEYVKLNNQFIVPVVKNGRVGALVILSLTLEVKAGMTQQVYQMEPKLRDGFLQVLFDHANAGGFDGAFTEANNMTVLRGALLEVARKALGSSLIDVLIVDIVRQDS